MPDLDRRPIFQAVRQLRDGRPFTPSDVAILDAGIDKALGAEISTPGPVSAPPAPIAPVGRQVSSKGIALIHSFEQCKLEAYPDPGSKDGNPWTIGWGSTGPDVKRGVVWTQEQCDERFVRDLAGFAAKVDAALDGSPANQNQFDAMVSLAYNIGIGAFQKSTVLRKHRAGDWHGAAAAYSLWIKNDGKIMRGLVRRRAAEADLYDDPEVGA
jgi:lysozyme